MITKQTFLNTLAFIQDQDAKFERLRAAAEDLSPGTYVDFLPECAYNDLIIHLLAETFEPYLFDSKGNLLDDGDTSILEYWLYDCEYGTKYEVGDIVITTLNPDTGIKEETAVDITSAEKLYDFLVSELSYRSSKDSQGNPATHSRSVNLINPVENPNFISSESDMLSKLGLNCSDSEIRKLFDADAHNAQEADAELRKLFGIKTPKNH